MKKPRYLGTPKRKIATPVLTCIPLDFTWNKKKNTCKSSHLWHFDLGAPTKSNPNRYSGISVQFSQSVMSDSLWSHGLQLAKLPCPSPTPKLAQTHMHRVVDAVQPSHPMLSPFPPAFNLSQPSGFSLMSQFFASSGQSVRASASVLSMNIQDWFPLGLTRLFMSECLINYRLYFERANSDLGEGNGTPLQYSCLENPMDRGAW